jgi:hypothetical protein
MPIAIQFVFFNSLNMYIKGMNAFYKLVSRDGRGADRFDHDNIYGSHHASETYTPPYLTLPQF